jgi:hypothetical protein
MTSLGHLARRAKTVAGAACVALLVSSSTAHLHATTVVIARVNGVVVIAADSLIVGVTKGSRSWGCKITPVENGFYFAASGVQRSNLISAKAFNSHEVAREECRDGMTLEECADDFTEAMTTTYRASLKHAAAINRETQGRDDPVINAAFVGWVETGPWLVVRNFWASVGENASEPEDLRVESRERDSDGFFLLSETPGPTSQAAIEGIEATGLVRWAEHVVEQAIEAKPDTVGPPIDILRIDKEGATWVRLKDGCPERPK